MKYRSKRNALSHFKRSTTFWVTTSKLMNRIKQQSALICCAVRRCWEALASGLRMQLVIAMNSTSYFYNNLLTVCHCWTLSSDINSFNMSFDTTHVIFFFTVELLSNLNLTLCLEKFCTNAFVQSLFVTYSQLKLNAVFQRRKRSHAHCWRNHNVVLFPSGASFRLDYIPNICVFVLNCTGHEQVYNDKIMRLRFQLAQYSYDIVLYTTRANSVLHLIPYVLAVQVPAKIRCAQITVGHDDQVYYFICGFYLFFICGAYSKSWLKVVDCRVCREIRPRFLKTFTSSIN